MSFLFVLFCDNCRLLESSLCKQQYTSLFGLGFSAYGKPLIYFDGSEFAKTNREASEKKLLRVEVGNVIWLIDSEMVVNVTKLSSSPSEVGKPHFINLGIFPAHCCSSPYHCIEFTNFDFFPKRYCSHSYYYAWFPWEGSRYSPVNLAFFWFRIILVEYIIYPFKFWMFITSINSFKLLGGAWLM